MLTKHRKIWNRFKRRGDRKARAELIREFVPLVYYVYRRMSLYLPRILDDADLISVGMIGLISAVDDFDIKREIEFTTFAVPRIRGAILDELREHDWVPRTARRRAVELDAAMAKSRASAFDAPDLSRVARLMGVTRLELGKMMNKALPVNFVSLDHSTDDDDNDHMSVSQVIADRAGESPWAGAELADQCKSLGAALGALPEVERNVLVQYYFAERMQKDIARQLQVSRSRVSQIHNHAITTLRERMAASGVA